VASSPAFAAEFTAAGDRIVAAAGETFIWDAESGRQLARWRDPDALLTVDLAGDRALNCTATSAAKVRRTDSGKLLAELVGHAGDVVSCRFSPDGKLAATGSSDGTARIWDAETGDLLAVMRGTGVEVRSVGFSRDGSRLVIAGDSGAAIWELPRFTGDFDRLIRCRVPFAVAGDRLVPRLRDPRACGAR